MRLLADVGGTNTRVALSQGGMIVEGSAQSYGNAEWLNLYEIVAAYLSSHSKGTLIEMVIAVAGPVKGDHAVLTNRNWTITAAQLTKSFGCDKAILLNDLTALGYSVPVLKENQIRLIRPGAEKNTEIAQSLVVGLGTGFNVSPVLEIGETVLCPSVEAGHVSMPLKISDALADIKCDASLFPTVETLFSGRGFALFCKTMTQVNSLTGVSAMASYGELGAEAVTKAINQYSALLGWLLRELSLAYMPSSGIYLAGSVGRSIALVAPDPCLDIHMRPCGFRDTNIPSVFAIEDDNAALFGCAEYS